MVDRGMFGLRPIVAQQLVELSDVERKSTLRGAGRNRRLNREAEIDDLLERPLRWIHDAEELANAITMFTCNNGATTRAPVQEALKCEFMQGVANGRSRDTQ